VHVIHAVLTASEVRWRDHFGNFGDLRVLAVDGHIAHLARDLAHSACCPAGATSLGGVQVERARGDGVPLQPAHTALLLAPR